MGVWNLQIRCVRDLKKSRLCTEDDKEHKMVDATGNHREGQNILEKSPMICNCPIAAWNSWPL